MSLTPEQRETVAAELKKIASDLNLSDDQKQRLHAFLAEASEKLEQYRQDNPKASREDLIKKIADNRASIRERVVGFLTAEQLSKWDAGVARAKEFLGMKAAA